MKIQSAPQYIRTQEPRGPQTPQTPAQPPTPEEQFVPSGDPQPPSRNWGKIVVKTAVATGMGALFGAGMAAGGPGGLISGLVGGGLLGATAIGPMGNGKGAEGLIYPVAGLAAGATAGAVAGLMGLPHGALIGGAAFGLLSVARGLSAESS